jgi:excisionase family DNA binding protein
MEQVQIISVNPEDLKNAIIQEVKNELDALKLHLQPQQQTKYLTRLEVCKLINVTLVTLHTWNKNGKLKAYGIGGRVLYRKEDIENAIIKL